MPSTRTVVFVCLHGAAKSVIAAAYLRRLAESRGLNICGTSAGIAPEPGVPSRVVEALLEEGIDVRYYRPQRATREELAAAWRVVSFGCDLSGIAPEELRPIRWDDVPLVSEGFAAARDAIVARLLSLLDSDPRCVDADVDGAGPCRRGEIPAAPRIPEGRRVRAGQGYGRTGRPRSL